AEGRKQDQDRILEFLLLLGGEVIERHDDRDRRADQRQNLHEARETVDDEAAAEGDELTRRQHGDERGGDEQERDGDPVGQLRRSLAAVDAEHEQRHGAERDHYLRQDRQQGGDLRGLVHGASYPLAPPLP